MTSHALMNNYGTRQITLSKGEGSWVWDDKGNKYLDTLSGIAVCGLGHAHPGVAQALCEQASTLTHCSNLYNIPQQQALAEKLQRISGMTNMFFGNSGAEANEAAIKLARLYGNNKGVEMPSIVVMENSFHGRTMATLSATGNRKVHAGFEPLVRGFIRAPYNDIEALKNIAKNNSSVVAVLVEPIQGEGGVNIPDSDYLTQIRQLCSDNDWLMMLDEIQTGNGRTGKFFNYQHSDILPDVVTTAKGLGNGVPIGVCLASGVASELMQPGNHGSTFGGNPLACAAALATISAIESDDLCANAASLGDYIQQQFESALNEHDHVIDIRGQGLMIGIELENPCTELVSKAASNGLIINVTAGSTIRLLPALNFTKEQADQMISTLVPMIIEEGAQENSKSAQQ